MLNCGHVQLEYLKLRKAVRGRLIPLAQQPNLELYSPCTVDSQRHQLQTRNSNLRLYNSRANM